MCIDLIDRAYNVLQCRLYIAEAYFDLAEFHISRIYCERVLRAEPKNKNAQKLHDRIKAVVARSMC